MSEQRLEQLFDQAEDVLFQNIIDQQEGILGAKENEEYVGCEPTAREIGHWEEELNKLVLVQENQGAIRPAPASHCRSRKKLLRVLLLVAIIASVLVISGNAIRMYILNWTETIGELYMEFRTGESAQDTVGGWNMVFIPTKIPAGYQISDAANTTSSTFIEYSNSEGHRVMFYQYAASAVVRIDTEAADEEIDWLGGHAYLFSKQEGETTTISWSSGDYAFSIEYNPSQLNREDIEEMAESLQWQP